MKKWIALLSVVVLGGCSREHLEETNVSNIALADGQVFAFTATNGWSGLLLYESNRVVVVCEHNGTHPTVTLELGDASIYAEIGTQTPTNAITTAIGSHGMPLYRFVSVPQSSESFWQVYTNGTFVVPERRSNLWWIGEQTASPRQLRAQGERFK